MYYNDVFDEANALQLLGSVQLHTDGKAAEMKTLASANGIFASIATTEAAPADVRADAHTRVEVLSRILGIAPPLGDLNPPAPVATFAAVPPRFAPTAPAVEPEFDVLASWTSKGTTTLSVLHVRVNVHPSASVMLRPSDFRINVTSPTGGQETVHGRDGPSFSYTRADYASSQANAVKTLPMVDPSEDMGYGPARTVESGDRLTKVISFVVRADADITDSTLQTLRWTPRRAP